MIRFLILASYHSVGHFRKPKIKKKKKFKTGQISGNIINSFYTHQNIVSLKIFKVTYSSTGDIFETEVFSQENVSLFSVLRTAYTYRKLGRN